jgi:uncharacterized C2H2 Zn-finger protein
MTARRLPSDYREPAPERGCTEWPCVRDRCIADPFTTARALAAHNLAAHGVAIADTEAELQELGFDVTLIEAPKERTYGPPTLDEVKARTAGGRLREVPARTTTPIEASPVIPTPTPPPPAERSASMAESFTCPTCDQTFSRQNGLSRHLSQSHHGAAARTGQKARSPAKGMAAPATPTAGTLAEQIAALQALAEARAAAQLSAVRKALAG